MSSKYLVMLLVFIHAEIYSAYGQTPKATDTLGVLTMDKVLAMGSEYDVIKPMVGNWQVQQKVWPKAGAEPVVTNQVARRNMVGHFLQEIMEPSRGSDMKPFTRITYFQFNNANHQWEYIVLDSRYPVMMFETSSNNAIQKGQELLLYLPAFVMPPGWDDRLTGQLAKQRRVIQFEGPDRTVMKQYWTLPSGLEFLAMEYTYTRLKG